MGKVKSSWGCQTEHPSASSAPKASGLDEWPCIRINLTSTFMIHLPASAFSMWTHDISRTWQSKRAEDSTYFCYTWHEINKAPLDGQGQNLSIFDDLNEFWESFGCLLMNSQKTKNLFDRVFHSFATTFIFSKLW